MALLHSAQVSTDIRYVAHLVILISMLKPQRGNMLTLTGGRALVAALTQDLLNIERFCLSLVLLRCEMVVRKERVDFMTASRFVEDGTCLAFCYACFLLLNSEVISQWVPIFKGLSEKVLARSVLDLPARGGDRLISLDWVECDCTPSAEARVVLVLGCFKGRS